MIDRATTFRWCIVPIGLLVVAGLFVRYPWQFREAPQKVILITLDTTRADRLGCYGYQTGETSSLDDIAQRGVVFEHAYAAAPITLPSHATVLTGLYPPEHGLRLNGTGRLPEKVPLLAEILYQQGYRTAAFTAAPVLDSRYGLSRGFDLYDDYSSQTNANRTLDQKRMRRPAHHVVGSALSWLTKHDTEKFFCWVHLFDAHGPYDAREDLFGNRFTKNPYDAGIAIELQQVTGIFAYLKKRGLDDKTLVVITADHGEGLRDHRESEHGMLAYNSTLHVPLMFVGTKACRPGKRVSTVVSLADIVPTILELLNLAAPEHLSGRSLKVALTGGELPSKPCYAEAETPFALNRLCPLRVAISDHWKYVRTSKPELYDLLADPAEQKNLADKDVDRTKEMENVLELMEQSFQTAQAQKLQLSSKQISDLEALGYTGNRKTSADVTGLRLTDLRDVKDVMPAMEKFEEAKRLAVEGKIDASIAVAREVEQLVGPGEFVEAGLILGDALMSKQNVDDAIEVFLTVLQKHPDFHPARLRLAAALREQGRLEQAEIEFNTFLKNEPESPTGHIELAKTLVKLQKNDDAIEEFRVAIRLAPNNVQQHLELGRLFRELKRSAEAENCFNEVLRIEPKNGTVRFELMNVLVESGEIAKAEEFTKRSVKASPNSYQAHFNLGFFLVSQKRLREGIAELRKAQKLRPSDPDAAKLIQQAEATLNQIGK